MSVKFLYKKEIACILGVSARTLRFWLNVKYYKDLHKLGYEKHYKQLTPSQVKYLAEKLDFNPTTN